MQRPTPLQRLTLWIAALIAVAAYYPRFIHDSAGVAVFSDAATCLLRGETPLHCPQLIFAYSPFTALMAVPLTVMPMWLREAVWYVLLIGTIFTSLRLCEALARRLFPGDWSEGELAAFRILTFVLSLKFILAVLENQAYDTIALIFILYGLLALVNGKASLSGASFAVAAALKVTPLIFLPYLLFKRRFKAAAVFIAVFVFLTILPDILLPPKTGWHVVIWGHEVLLGSFIPNANFKLLFWITDSPMNQSFRAAIARIFAHGDRNPDVEFARQIMEMPQFNMALRVVSGLYIAVIGILMLKSVRNDRLVPVDGALLLISALLLSPVSSQSHFVGLVLPYAIIAAALVKDRSSRASGVLVLLASYVLATATSNDVAGRDFTGWSLWHSLPVYGTLVLVVQLGVLIWTVGRKRDEIAA